MKNIIKTWLMIILIPTMVISNTNEIDYGAVNTDSINIRGMLVKQINEIREKENVANSETPAKVEVTEAKVINEKNAVKISTVLTKEESELKGLLKSFLLFVELSLLVLLGYFVKKRYDKINKLKVIELKRNVKDLREEKIGSYSNTELSVLRMKLNSTKINLKDSGREITQQAKRLAISKGEVHLAAKIKMMTQTN